MPGLRREETALLVGVSPQYYIRLERGDATGVSDSVIDGIAHALRLDDAERAHLLDLLRTAGAPARARKRRPPAPHPGPADDPAPRSTRCRPCRQSCSTAASTCSPPTALGRALFSPWYDTDEPVNNARLVFLDPRATSLFRDWETVANDTVALLRAEAGRDPYDRQLSDLVGELSTRSEDFRLRWAAHDVRIHSTGVKKLHHPIVGDLDLPFESLPLEAGATTSLVTYLARTRHPVPRRARPARQLGRQRAAPASRRTGRPSATLNQYWPPPNVPIAAAPPLPRGRTPATPGGGSRRHLRSAACPDVWGQRFRPTRARQKSHAGQAVPAVTSRRATASRRSWRVGR